MRERLKKEYRDVLSQLIDYFEASRDYSVRGNQKARMVVQASRHDEGFVVYEGHNTGMLIFAAWMDGQSGVAFSAAQDMARMNPDAFNQYDL